jgi:pimeloyl-ACP methyl ester carboxylesterase
MASIVFIHGAADSGEVWEKQVESLVPRHDVLALDLPGRGARLSEAPLETVASMAQEALRAAQSRGMARPVWWATRWVARPPCKLRSTRPPCPPPSGGNWGEAADPG